MIHPVTGEIIETVEDYRRAMFAVEKEMMPLFTLRRALREGLAAEHEPPIPEPRHRTPTQERVAQCPRCGAKLEGMLE